MGSGNVLSDDGVRAGHPYAQPADVAAASISGGGNLITYTCNVTTTKLWMSIALLLFA